MSVDLQRSRRARPDRPAEAGDRLPPHSVEAEQGVLGSVFLQPGESMGEAVEKIPTPEVFYDLRHRTIYEVLIEMYDRREPIDTITVGQRLRDRQQLEAIGGGAYLSSLPDSVPSAANVGYYINVVREKFILRRLLQAAAAITASVYEHEGEVDSLLDHVERDILAINQIRTGAHAGADMKQLVSRAVTTIEDFHQRQGALTGISTGFPDLDRMTSGLVAGDMIVIAARPSVGKTSLAMNIAEHIAAGPTPIPVGVFSLEMTADSLVLRMLCSRARVNLRNLRDGILTERDFAKLFTASKELSQAKLHIDDTSGLSILQLRAKARRMYQQHGIKLFVIDYMQKLHSTNRRADNRQQEISDISNGVKDLAKELLVPVIIAAQLNRASVKENRKPRLDDLRESGAIEQDADVVILLYRPEDDGDAPSKANAIPVHLLIEKQRNGPTGDVPLTFLKPFTRFESASKIHDDDVP